MLKDNILVELAAAAALAQIGAPALEPLLAALKEPDLDLRKGVAGALGRMGDKRAVEPLLAALAGAEKNLRMSIWGAFGLIGDTRAVEPLIQALKGEWDEGLSAAEALGRIGDKRAVEPLIDAIKYGDYTIRGYIAKSLGQIGDPRAVPALESILYDPLPVCEDIKNSASEAIKKIKENIT